MKEFAGFDIEQLDDLARRQRVSPLLERVPLWAIRAVTQNAGERQPKIPSYFTTGGYSSGYNSGYNAVTGWDSSKNQIFRNGRWVDKDSANTSGVLNPPWPGYQGAAPWASQNVQKFRDKHAKKIAVRDSTEKGNLKEQDYRFWEGTRSGPIVKCRWCGEKCPTKELRTKHFKESGNCSKLLRVVFDTTMKHAIRWCFVCGKITESSRWGLPLCNTTECITDWKFKCYDTHKEFNSRINIARSLGYLKIYEDSKSAKA